MSFFSWLASAIGKRRSDNGSGSRKPKAGSRKPLRFRPQLEALEDRWLPSTLTVTSLKDSGPHSLRAEIAAAQPNDVIVFSSELDGQTIKLTSGELGITKNLTIQGPGAGQLTISGNNSSRVFDVAQNTTVTLSGLTISYGHGFASYFTGDPMAGFGGGIMNHGILTVSSSIVSRNTAPYNGGGIYNDGTLTISSSTVSGNSAENGGAIYNDGTATVSSTIVSNNCAKDQTGFPYFGYIYFGGGIYNAGTLSVTGSTVSGNYGDLGGGIMNFGLLTVSACTVTNNSASGSGGGIYNASFLTVSNSHFSSNYPDSIYGPYTDGGGNTFN